MFAVYIRLMTIGPEIMACCGFIGFDQGNFGKPSG
jgi:hypothetical protein